MEWILELKLEADRPKNQTPKPGSQFYSCMEPQPRFLEEKNVLEKNNYNWGAHLRLTCSSCLVLVPVIRNCI